MNDCPRLGKWIGGCRFKARFSMPAFTVPPGITYHPLNDSASSVLDSLRPRTYEGDVCVRCGKRASRDPLPSQDEAPLSQAKPVQGSSPALTGGK